MTSGFSFRILDSRVCSRVALEEVNNKLQPSSFPKRVTPRKWNKWPNSKQFEWVDGWKCPAPNSCHSKRHLGEDSPNFLLKWCDIGIVHLDECLTFFSRPSSSKWHQVSECFFLDRVIWRSQHVLKLADNESIIYTLPEHSPVFPKCSISCFPQSCD